MESLYPLKFEPVFKYRMWGGEKLRTLLNKDCSDPSIGESWEISDVEGDQTLVNDGPLKGKTLCDLITKYKGQVVGERVYESFGNKFPLLIKFIDAKTPLSIQVHPNDTVAKLKHNSFGKNEMWYVMQADKDAELIVGFDAYLDKSSYQDHLKKNTILDVMHHEKVTAGDAFYIPTGRVHAIGSGVLLAEIQQTSDITYRIYDYDRVDKQTGEKRELHNDLALDVIDFVKQENYKTEFELDPNVSNRLIHSPNFKTNILYIKGSLTKDYSSLDSFVIMICVEGTMKVVCEEQAYRLRKGETLLIPAAINNLIITAQDAKCIECYL